MRTRLSSLLGVCTFIPALVSAVTVYHQQGQQALGTASGSAAAANYTGAAAYNPTVLNAPPPPSPPINTTFPLQLTSNPQGLSITQNGAFFGFSIEMSVVNQVLGKNASFIQVPFLNLMANLQQRGGRVQIRVGGNTQDYATLVASTPDGKILEKDLSAVTNPTETPPIIFTLEYLYLMGNVSSLVNVQWYLGVPFNDTSNFRLGIAEAGQRILGSNLLGLQVANEPDLYLAHLHRTAPYDATNYTTEFGELVTAMAADSQISRQNMLIGPNIQMGWTPQQVWDTGFIDTYSASLAYLAVERYPTDNCFPIYGVGTLNDPQTTFPDYLNHTAATSITDYYISSTQLAQQKGKQFLMFETNTASCGGFAGISDAFGAALWGLDYGMQMAYTNFSAALFHVGGQNVFYNPFTPPPTNQSTFHQWSIGPIYYSALVMAEALGSSNVSQVLDLSASGLSIFTPAYAIYENGVPVRVLIINFITDSTGANDVTANIAVGGGTTGQPASTPGSVKVKYLAASSVSQKGNYTWAGQTFGGNFESDGRLQGTEDIQTATCDTTLGTCAIKVPAPGAALVFLTDTAFSESEQAKPSTTFPTTALTKTDNTATVDPSVLSTSNGHQAGGSKLGSTSKGSVSAAERLAVGSAVVLGAVILGVGIVLRGAV